MSADGERADQREQPRRPRRGPGRFFAPLALIAVIVALIVIVSAARSSNRASPAPVVAATTSRTTSRAAPSTRRPKSTQRAKSATATPTGTTSTGTGTVGTYTIESGDSFGVISSKTGVSVAMLERLNPSASSTSLTVGEVIKLK